MPHSAGTNTEPTTFDRLVEAASRGAIGFIGAGSSARVDYPSWSVLLDELDAMARSCSPDKAGELDKVKQAGWLVRAQVCEELLGRDRFRECLSEQFGPREPQFSEFHKALVRIPFRHVLTTNYDQVLQAAHEAEYDAAAHMVDLGIPDQRTAFVTSYQELDYTRQYVHVHGSVQRPEGMVITKRDYDQLYHQSVFKQPLKTLFTGTRVIFIGFRMEDPDFMYLLRELGGELGLTDPRHFVLYPHPGDTAAENELRANLERMHFVEPFFYNPANDHAELGNLVEQLAEQATRSRQEREQTQRQHEVTIDVASLLDEVLADQPEARDIALDKLPEALERHSEQMRFALPEAEGHSGTDIDREIDGVFVLVDSGCSDEAIAQYRRIEHEHAGQLDNRLRYRIKANIANALYAKGDEKGAAHLYLEAVTLYCVSKVARGLEVLAYFLLGVSEKAHSLASALCADEPDYGRAHSLRIRTAPADVGFEELIQSVPAELLNDAEVALAISDVAARHGLPETQEHYARRALAVEPDWVDALATTAMTVLQREKATAGLDVDSGVIPENSERVQEAEQLITKAIASIPTGLDHRLGNLHFNRSVARRMVGNTEGAQADVREAFRRNPGEAEIVLAYAMDAGSTDKLSEAITALEPLCSDAEYGARASFVLALKLNERSLAGDKDRALAVLQEQVAQIHQIEPRAYRLDICRFACKLLIEANRGDVAKQLISDLDDDALHPAMREMLLGRVMHDVDEAVARTEHAKRSIALLDDQSTWFDRREAAMLGQECGLWPEAFAVWKAIVPTDRVNSDTQSLLVCAYHAGEVRFILDYCESLRQKGVYDRKCIEFEVQTLTEWRETKDAVAVLREWLARDPTDKEARLALSVIGLQEDVPEIVETRASHLPGVDEVLSPERGAGVVHVLRRVGDPMVGLQYAYALWRRFPDTMAGQWTLIGALRDPTAPPVSVPRPSVVDVDSAVLIAREEETAHWITIESEPAPSAIRGEYAVEHGLSQALLGHRVDDEFTFEQHKYRIRGFEHKIVHRVYELMEHFEERFPGRQVLRRLRVPDDVPEEAPIEEKLGEVWTQLKQYDEHVGFWLDRYSQEPLPIAQLARRIGKSVFETMRGLVARSDLRINYAIDSLDEWKASVKATQESKELVVDDTALTTIFVLGLQPMLGDLGYRIVVPQSAVNEIVEASHNAGGGKDMRGYLGVRDNRPVLEESTPEQMAGEVRRLEGMLAYIRDHCEVAGARALLELPADAGKGLCDFVGEGAADALAIARARKIPLWTDDQAVAVLGKHPELAVRRVWTQVVLLQAADIGVIDHSVYARHIGGLVAGGYSFVRVSAADIVEILRACEWQVRGPTGRGIARLMNEVGLTGRQNRIISGLSLLLVWERCPTLERAKQCIVDLLEIMEANEAATELARIVYRELPLKVLKRESLRPLKQFLRSWRSGDGEFKNTPGGNWSRLRSGCMSIRGDKAMSD